MVQLSSAVRHVGPRSSIVLGLFTLLICATPIHAANPVPDAQRGLALAMKSCAGCHLIGDGRARTTPVGVPTFRQIANRKDQSAARIRAALVMPHPPMPDTHLTQAEVLDIIAYLDTLRDPSKGLPSLLPSDKRKKVPKARDVPS